MKLKPLKGKHMFGTVKIGEKGQILIPKEAREVFGLNPGDKLLMLGDEKRGIALIKVDSTIMQEMFSHAPELESEALENGEGDET